MINMAPLVSRRKLNKSSETTCLFDQLNTVVRRLQNCALIIDLVQKSVTKWGTSLLGYCIEDLLQGWGGRWQDHPTISMAWPRPSSRLCRPHQVHQLQLFHPHHQLRATRQLVVDAAAIPSSGWCQVISVGRPEMRTFSSMNLDGSSSPGSPHFTLFASAEISWRSTHELAMTPILFCSYTEMWFENRKLVLDLLGIGAIFLLVLDFLSVLNLLGKWCTSLLVLNLLVKWCDFLLVLNLLESGVFLYWV